MISKELLSEVYPEAIPYMEDISKIELLNYTEVHYGVYSSSHINIYELMYLCKEWASEQQFKVDNSYGLYSLASYKDVQYTNTYCCFNNFRNLDAKMPSFSADTETKAIFKACEWILKERS